MARQSARDAADSGPARAFPPQQGNALARKLEQVEKKKEKVVREKENTKGVAGRPTDDGGDAGAGQAVFSQFAFSK